MPVTVDFPDDLPCVSRIDGFSMTSAAACIRTPFEAGNTRQRRLHARLPTEITLAWRVRNVDLQPLVAWLNTFGFDWFNLKLAGFEASQLDVFATPIAVRLMSDLRTQLMQFHRENWWTVSASAEYQPPVTTLPSGSSSGAAAMMFVPLHRVEPDPVYGELVYVNMDQSLSMSRNLSDTGTRVRGTVVDPTTTESTLRVQALPARSATPRATDVPMVNQEWTLDALTVAGPGSGRLRLNNAAQAQATMSWINYTTADSVDMKNILLTVQQGAELYLQDKSDSTKWARYAINGAPVDRSTYIELPAAYMAGGVQMLNQRVIALVYQEGTAPGPSPQPNLIEVIVKETPQQIAAIVAGAQRVGTRIVGAPRLSPAAVAQ